MGVTLAIFGAQCKSRHRGSILGAFWLVANPLLMLGLYVFAFGVVFGGRFTDSPDESTIDYALGVFLGLNVLGLVSGIIGSSPGIIVSQPNFVKKWSSLWRSYLRRPWVLWPTIY